MRGIGFLIIFILFSGCISLCGDCDDSNPCTKDYCAGFGCAHDALTGSQTGCNAVIPPCRMQSCAEGICSITNISNCCGNGLCEANEDISNCAADCTTSIKLDCNASSPLVPILLKLEDELDTDFIYCTIANTGTSRASIVFNAQVPGWSDNYTETLDLFPGMSERIGIDLSWKDKLYTNRETADAQISFNVQRSGVTVASQTKSIKISPKEDIFWAIQTDGYQIQLYRSIVAWVTPHDACISALITKAKELAPGRSLGGYANYGGHSAEEKANMTMQQARAIFYAIKGQGVSYVNTPVSFSGSQRIKMPSDSINEKSGNCVDGSVLFASAFEALGMNPVIVIIPKHTFVGVETYQDSRRYIFIETTMVGSSSFEEAVNEGSRQYNLYKNGTSLSAIDVAQYRGNITPFPSFTNCSLDARCADGTTAGTCSTEKPSLCIGTGYVDAASVCGCPYGYYASGDSCYSSIVKNQTFVLGTSRYDQYYYWSPELGPGYITYRYMVESSEPIQVYFLPSRSDFEKMKSGKSFLYYPAYAGTNTLSFDESVIHASDGGIALYNDGKNKATVSLLVLEETG